MTDTDKILSALEAELNALPKGKGGRPNGNACNKRADEAAKKLIATGMAKDDARIAAHLTNRRVRWGF